MTLQTAQFQSVFPPTFLGNPRITWSGTTGGMVFNTVGTMDAAGEKVAFIGEVFWDGRPGSAKTMDSTSKIHFRTGLVTFADAGTTLRIGLQDVITASGTTMTPDGTFDVYADVIGNGGLITSSDDNVVKSITLSTSGTKSVAHGDLVAVVFDMTARAGSDSVIIAGLQGIGNAAHPTCLSYVSSWFLGSTQLTPVVLLEASDGTFGYLRGGTFLSSFTTYSFQASSTPDEYGLIFQVPWKCKVDGVVAMMSSNSANADATLTLYSTPLGTPSSQASETILGEQGNGGTSESPWLFQFSSEVTLEANTDYCIAIAGTGTAAVDLSYITLASANHRSVLGWNNCRRGSRTDGSGAFSETTTEIPMMAVLVSAFDDGTGSGRVIGG